MVNPAQMSVLSRLAGRQYGLVASKQVRNVLSGDQVRRWVERGWLVRMAPGVYALPGATPSWRQRAMAACLAYGQPVAVSGPAAARLWELDGIGCGAIEVTVPRGRSGRIPNVVTHRRSLTDHEITSRFGVPVTTMARTLIDLCGTVADGALSRAVDDAIVRRLVTPTELAGTLQQAAFNRRRGIASVRRLVGRRLAEGGDVDSVWEANVYRWLVDGGLPPPVRQCTVVINGVPRTLDLAYPGPKVAVEFQGFRYHALQRSRFDADQDRTTDLILAGWLVVLVTSGSSPDETVARVRQALDLRP